MAHYEHQRPSGIVQTESIQLEFPLRGRHFQTRCGAHSRRSCIIVDDVTSRSCFDLTVTFSKTVQKSRCTHSWPILFGCVEVRRPHMHQPSFSGLSGRNSPLLFADYALESQPGLLRKHGRTSMASGVERTIERWRTVVVPKCVALSFSSFFCSTGIQGTTRQIVYH